MFAEFRDGLIGLKLIAHSTPLELGTPLSTFFQGNVPSVPMSFGGSHFFLVDTKDQESLLSKNRNTISFFTIKKKLRVCLDTVMRSLL